MRNTSGWLYRVIEKEVSKQVAEKVREMSSGRRRTIARKIRGLPPTERQKKLLTDIRKRGGMLRVEAAMLNWAMLGGLLARGLVGYDRTGNLSPREQ